MRLKIISMLIIVLMTITGCQSVQNELPDENITSEYDKLIVTDINYDQSTKTISYKTENKSEKTISTGLYYTVEKYENNNWVKTNLTDNMVVIEIALLLEPNKQTEEKIDLSQIDKLQDGYYRIKKEYFSEDNVINQYIEFKSNNNDISSFTSYNSIRK